MESSPPERSSITICLVQLILSLRSGKIVVEPGQCKSSNGNSVEHLTMWPTHSTHEFAATSCAITDSFRTVAVLRASKSAILPQPILALIDNGALRPLPLILFSTISPNSERFRLVCSIEPHKYVSRITSKSSKTKLTTDSRHYYLSKIFMVWVYHY